MYNSRKLVRLSMSVCLLLIAHTLTAQTSSVNRYKQTTFSGTWSSINGNGGTKLGGGDDGVYNTTLIPFAFNYDSSAKNPNQTFYVGDNGACGYTAPYCCQYT